MRLHGFFRSSASWRVRIALNLKGIEVDHVARNLRKAEHRKADYLALNPQGLVPTLEVDGVALGQSLAIIEWLEERYPEPALLPADPVAKARVRALAQMAACDIHPLQNPRVQAYLRQQFGQGEQAVTAWCAHWNALGLAGLEAAVVALAAGPFSAGERPGLSDICLVPQMASARRFGVDLAPYPTLLAIEGRCMALSAFQDAVPERQADAQ